jgi:outer membrane protein TolC
MTISANDLKTAQIAVATTRLGVVTAQNAFAAAQGALNALQAQKAIDDLNAGAPSPSPSTGA